MRYSPGLIFHICGGIIAVISGFVALVVRKGSRLHRRSGDIFVISMMTMAASGAYIAFVKAQIMNVLAGVFTFYLVATAWVTVARKQKETGFAEYGMLLVALAAGTGALIVGRESARYAGTCFVFAVLAFLSAAGDVRVLIRGGVSGTQRLVRHLWRMCFAQFIAVGSFFLGTADDPAVGRTGLRSRLFTAAIRKTHLPEVPVLIVVVLMVYWLWRVQFTNTYKKAGVASSAP
jgi:uncharacterized membrane protein